MLQSSTLNLTLKIETSLRNSNNQDCNENVTKILCILYFLTEENIFYKMAQLNTISGIVQKGTRKTTVGIPLRLFSRPHPYLLSPSQPCCFLW